MYRVTLRDLDLPMDGYRTLLAESHEDLRAIVTLAPEARYKIIAVKLAREPLQTVSEFLEEIKDKIKPKDLVFGIDDESSTNFNGDPLDIEATNSTKTSADVQVDNTNQKEE